MPVAVAAGGNQAPLDAPAAFGGYPYTFAPGAPVGAAYPPGSSFPAPAPSKRSAYFGKVHIDPGTLQECDEAGCATTTRDVQYTVAHELGHAWETHLGTYADSAQEQEDFAECIAGAVGAEAGWDVYAMAEYTWGLQDDELHGTGDHRYDMLLAGADYGHEYCEAAYLP